MAERIVFHFNKASIGRDDIAPWVIKTRGQTYAAWHVESSIGFSTKETPENPHTKGSIQFRGTLRMLDVDGRMHAFITE